MIAAQLHESRTAGSPWFAIVPTPEHVYADAFLVIQNGRIGPRGGVSKYSLVTYYVQEELLDPDHELAAHQVGGRLFLIGKLTPPKRDDEEAGAIYRVWIPKHPRYGSCSCPAGHMVGSCKHYDTFEYLVRTAGMDDMFRIPAEPVVKYVPCCDRPECFLCFGTGIVEVENAPVRTEEEMEL